jgi:serine/threonine protein kinase
MQVGDFGYARWAYGDCPAADTNQVTNSLWLAPELLAKMSPASAEQAEDADGSAVADFQHPSEAATDSQTSDAATTSSGPDLQHTPDTSQARDQQQQQKQHYFRTTTATDVFAFGCVMYELVTCGNDPPYESLPNDQQFCFKVKYCCTLPAYKTYIQQRPPCLDCLRSIAGSVRTSMCVLAAASMLPACVVLMS